MNKTAIICVDDEEIILSSLGAQLKRSLGKDYDIELASSGDEALDLCAELTAEGIAIAVVISDQIMPGMSGDEFLIKLHADYPKTLNILLTGQAEADSVGNIVNAASLYRYITKPWDETDLILTVKEALRCYEQEQQLAEKNILLQEANNRFQKTNHKLTKSLKLLLAVFQTSGDGILVLDNKGEIVIFNQKFATFWQIESNLIKGNIENILSLISHRLVKPMTFEAIKQKFQCDLTKKELFKLRNGTILESYFQTHKLHGNIVGRVWGFRDVTAKEREKEKALHKAQFDTLTELPKRRILICQLTDAISKAKKNSHLLTVMFLDLDRFKMINETLGHQIGDLLLRQVVHRLRESVREEDMIARWGNDEFTLLLPKIYHQDETTAIANRILESFESPFVIDNRNIYLTLGIGIAIYPEHGTDAETLLKNADSALSQAQQMSRHNYQYYDPTFSNQTHQLLALENLLHSALKKNEFIVYYQPIVNVTTGKIAKMEALLRWKNDQLGLVAPYLFIPLAEENGSIIPIGEWVLKTACAQNKIWQNMGLDPIKISVNLSVRQFQQPNLVATIARILEETQLDPCYLELEITESITMDDTELAKTILTELHDMGISLSMDDFGTGYSSLGYLRQFPFHTLKIDRSFVKDLHPNSQDIAIVNAVIALGQGLELNVVAEGVETEKLRDLLKNLGCEYIQGYFFSRPVPAIEATRLFDYDFRE
ncbi:MAG: EAL domain-containing protein [Cyanobacteria bacterium P01_F01_bin.143]